MSTRLVTAILARNEAGEDRYLRRVLARCKEFSDTILVVDDGSTDDTTLVANNFGCIVHAQGLDGFWGKNEVPARKYLWEQAAELAGDGWVLICDADMLLEGDPRSLCASWDCAAWAWPLADCWDSEDTFRVDGPWGFGCNTPRPWLFRPSTAPQDFVPVWPESRIHTGHSPANFGVVGPTFTAPPDVFWKHLSYVKPEHRRAKHAQYTSIAHELNDFQRSHAESILD